MSDGRQNPSFWETIPGIITAIGTLLGGAAALITALYTANIIGYDDPGKVSAKSTQESGIRKAAAVEKTTGTARAASSQVATQPVSATKSDHSILRQGTPMIDLTTGMEFVFVPEGCFQMGQTAVEKKQLIAEVGQKDYDSYYKGEIPQHEVCVDGFWMGKYEVTQGQWQKIMGDNPAKFQKGDKYPVEQVSWEDAQKFIVELNKRSGKRYRLPTEAEWEYAARAGTKTSRYWGDDISCDKAMYDNYSETDNCAKYVRKRGLQNGSTAPVGSYSSNQFGLYDMLGNVYEWCADWYGDYASSSQTNPVGPFSGSDRVMRGGSWLGNGGRYVRSAYRYHYSPDGRLLWNGFRLVLGQ